MKAKKYCGIWGDDDMTPDELYNIIADEIDSIYDACHAGPLMVRAYLGVIA